MYKATVKTSREVKEYIGSTGDTFKKRFYGHSRTFRNRDSAHTTLSKYMWDARCLPSLKNTIDDSFFVCYIAFVYCGKIYIYVF